MNKYPEFEEDYEVMLVCAVRYALGRCTYMPSLVQRYVSAVKSDLATGTLEIMVRDVDEWGGVDHDHKAYGWECDYKSWMKFLDGLKEELARRGEPYE